MKRPNMSELKLVFGLKSFPQNMKGFSYDRITASCHTMSVPAPADGFTPGCKFWNA